MVAVTDPPDPLADIAREARKGAIVLSAGTYLDSQRFRVHLGKHFGVDPAHVEAQVIGDHGTAQVFLWSSARVGGVPIASLLKTPRRKPRRIATAGRKGCALRQRHHHRGPQRQSVWHRHCRSPHRRDDPHRSADKAVPQTHCQCCSRSMIGSLKGLRQSM